MTMYTKFHELSDTERSVHLLQHATLRMMYLGQRVSTYESLQMEEELPVEVFDFLLDMSKINTHYKWTHLARRQPDFISPIDGERCPVYFHKIYLYKEYV